jgi:hypothetical protein
MSMPSTKAGDDEKALTWSSSKTVSTVTVSAVGTIGGDDRESFLSDNHPASLESSIINQR